MSIVSGGYGLLTGGVSQQDPVNMLRGQVLSQDNFLTDPLRGPVLRPGTHNLGQMGTLESPSDELAAAIMANYAGYGSLIYRAAGKEYLVVYQKENLNASIGLVSCFCLTDGTQIPVHINYSSLDMSSTGKVTGAVQAGNYLFFAGPITPVYTATTVQQPSDHWTVWFKKGEYDRKITMTIQEDHPTLGPNLVTKTVTLPSATYNVALDTSWITPPSSNSNYQQQVNDAVNAWQHARDNYQLNAAKQIVPGAIAQAFQTAFSTDLLYTAVQADYNGAGQLWIQPSGPHAGTVVSVTVTTTGLSSDVVVTGPVVTSVDSLPPQDVRITGHQWRTIKISPVSGKAYYVKAKPIGAELADRLQDVLWEEAPGEKYAVTQALLYGAIIGGALYLGANKAQLNSLHTHDWPDYSSSNCGDTTSVKPPKALASGVDYLCVFQDRLALCADGEVFFSKSGDYLNWFPASVLAVADDDPVAFTVTGGSDDVVLRSGYLDNNLILLGKKFTYSISGQAVLTSSNIQLVVSGAFPDSLQADPVVFKNSLVLLGDRGNYTTAQSISAGDYFGSFRSQDLCQQLSDYLQGNPVQVLSMTQPDYILVRTSGDTNAIYVLRLLQTGQGGIAAWSRMTFGTPGVIVSAQVYAGKLYLARLVNLPASTSPSQTKRIIMQVDTLDLTDRVYDGVKLDGQCPAVNTNPEFYAGRPWFDNTVAAVATGDMQYFSSPVDGATELGTIVDEIAPDTSKWVVGYSIDASIELPPVWFRDQRNNEHINIGRLTVNRVCIRMTHTAGALVEVSRNGVSKVKPVGPQGTVFPPTSFTLKAHECMVAVGKEQSSYRLIIRNRGVSPLTVGTIDWEGHFFSNRR